MTPPTWNNVLKGIDWSKASTLQTCVSGIVTNISRDITMNKVQNYINHIAFVVDRSGSMHGLSSQVVKVFDTQIQHLAKRSQELDQETRATVYLFDHENNCLFYDKDVMRLPSLAAHYSPRGNTALIDATMLAIDELGKTAQLHGDHAFLLYVLTDGQENASRTRPDILAKALETLPDNWTVAVLVPNALGVAEAKRFGFSSNNIMQWEATAKGMEEVGVKMRAATDSYMAARATGVRGTKSLFTLDTSSLASRKVSDNLNALPDSRFILAEVTRDSDIRTFVESKVGSYVKGNTYYQLTKKEEVQPYKQVAVQNKVSGRVYTGTEARDLLQLPATTVNVKPESGASKFNIFIQSTSVNRKLIAGTKALILR